MLDNSKIASLEPQWAWFAGFSYLFDHGDGERHLKPFGDGFQSIDCRRGVDSISLYERIHDVVQPLFVRLREECLFCPLPFESYHVTCWDGINTANLSKLKMPIGDKFGELLRGLPASFSMTLPGPSILHGNFFPETLDPWSIRFRFRELIAWGGQVLVARLTPADEQSQQVLDDIVKRRVALDQLCKAAFSEEEFSAVVRKEYSPHVSLGYFPVRSLADRVSGLVDRWTICLRDQIGPASIEFSSASLYSFTSMVKFFKR